MSQLTTIVSLLTYWISTQKSYNHLIILIQKSIRPISTSGEADIPQVLTTMIVTAQIRLHEDSRKCWTKAPSVDQTAHTPHRYTWPRNPKSRFSSMRRLQETQFLNHPWSIPSASYARLFVRTAAYSRRSTKQRHTTKSTWLLTTFPKQRLPAILKDCVTTFGTPQIIMNECGAQFLSFLFREFNNLLCSKQFKMTAYYLRANVLVERFHRF